MNYKILLLTIFSFFQLINNSTSQKIDEKPKFVVPKSGDTMYVSKIYEQSTNEDQVVFSFEGNKKSLTANEVASYYGDSYFINAKLDSDNSEKLVKIVLQGKVKLATAKSAENRSDDNFFILSNGKWTLLDSKSKNLKKQIAGILPQFNQAVKDKKLYYDLSSLGNAISEYNEYMNPGYRRRGSFRYSDGLKVFLYGSLGSSSVNLKENDVDFSGSLTPSFGIGGQVYYSRYFSFMTQIGYTQSKFEATNWLFDLKTLDITPLLGVQVYDNPGQLKITALAGFNLNIDLASKLYIEGIFESKKLRGLSGGYDFQIHTMYKDRLSLILSYQIMPSQKSESFSTGIFNEHVIFSTNQLRLGVAFYL